MSRSDSDAKTDAVVRPRVIIGAYACGPCDEPEANAGWEFAKAAAENFDVVVVCRKRFGPMIDTALAADPLLASRLRVVTLDLSDRVLRFKKRPRDIYWYYVLWQKRLAREARRLHREQPFDVAHHITFANDWLPAGLRTLTGVPFVWGPVGGGSRLQTWTMRTWLGTRGVVTELVRDTFCSTIRVFGGRAAARAASLVVAQNSDVAAQFPRARRVVVEPNAALDLAQLPTRPTTRAPGPHRAIIVSRLIPLKGIPIALEALSRIRSEGWALDVYGDGPLRRQLEQLAGRFGIDDIVNFRGHRPRSEVLSAMAGSDVLLFPSMHDQAGWAVAEASSIGLPVVCLGLGGPPDLAGANGFVVKAGRHSVADFARNMTAAVAAGGEPTERWSLARLPGLVRSWYLDVMSDSRAGDGGR